MDNQVALLLLQDGLINGTVYALLAIATVLLFSVTRILFLPLGDFLAYGGVTLAVIQSGHVPQSIWALGGGAGLLALIELGIAIHKRRFGRLKRVVILDVMMPAAVIACTLWLVPSKPPVAVQILLTMAIVVPLGPIVYRLAFQPLRNASILVLLITGIAVHYVLLGLGQAFFGVEGYRVNPYVTGQYEVGSLHFTGQSLLIIATSIALMILLYGFFAYTREGKALRATAMNQLGARLSGIMVSAAGNKAFVLAALIGAISGVLFVGMSTTYYDSGFLLGLFGFTGSVFGGVQSYPLAVLGAVVIGVVESFAAFVSSEYKDAIVFLLLVPALLVLSLRHRTANGHSDEA